MNRKNFIRSVGVTIAMRRKAQGFTQAQFAEALGIEKETVSRIETGVISTTLSRLVQIAEILECSVCALFPMTSTSAPAGTDNHSEQLKHIGEMLESLDGERRSLVVRFVGEMVKLLQHRT
jgi:transcriptional regulator with XRE-family HTH domain